MDIIQQATRIPKLKYIYDIDVSRTSLEQFNYILNNPYEEEQMQFRLFAIALEDIKTYCANTTTPCMLELGSSGIDGSYYSILFEKYFNYVCNIINTEPRKYLLDWVRVAWKNKHLDNAKLIHCYTGVVNDVCGVHEGQVFEKDSTPRYSVSELMKMCDIKKLHMLHCDIQGAEIQALEEIINDGAFNNVLYYFISLHNTYAECSSLLKETNIKIIYAHPNQGGHGDGLLAFKNLNFIV